MGAKIANELLLNDFYGSYLLVLYFKFDFGIVSQ